MVRLGARRLRAGGRGLGHEDPGAVHVGGGAEARAGSHGLEGTEDETLGLGYTGAAERAGSGARLAWEVAESAWHGGDQGVGS